MWWETGAVVVGGLLVYLSIRQRVQNIQLADVDKEQVEAKPSPVSQAIQEMVATAGGIYLALVMATSFLKLDLPARVNVIGMQVDPLALVALALAVFYPFIVRFRKPRK